MNSLLLSALTTFLLSCSISPVSGHAKYLVTTKCNEISLVIGTSIMGQPAQADTLGRTMLVKRNGVAIVSGSSYIPGETLDVTLSTWANGIQTTFEAKSASFQSGVSCTGGGTVANSRVTASTEYIGIDSTTKTAVLVLPSSGSGSVTILAAVASGYGTVSLTPAFILNAPPSRSPTRIPTSPTRVPSRSPSVSPTRLPSRSPTSAPSRSPTRAPSWAPTRTPSSNPTRAPTRLPSRAPSRSPTRSPTNNPSRAPTESPTRAPTRLPSKAPSRSPTRSPTFTPSRAPTSAPSRFPTRTPTTPTASPTVLPLTVSTLAGNAVDSFGNANGVGTFAMFRQPYAVTASSSDDIYIADYYNHLIRKYSPSSGLVSTVAGSLNNNNPGSVNSVGTYASFWNPGGITMMNADAALLVADTSNDLIRQVTLATSMVTTYAGAKTPANTLGNYATGVGTFARFRAAYGVVVMPGTGLVVVGDTSNHCIRFINPTTRIVTTVAGNPGSFGAQNGIGTNAYFKYPTGLATSYTSSSFVFIADCYNHAIRMMNVATYEVTTIAGVLGVAGAVVNGQSNLATFDRPYSLAVLSQGDIIVADTYNYLIRKISSASEANGARDVSTVAGREDVGQFNEGMGTEATFYLPYGLVASKTTSNKVFVADSGNNAIRSVQV